MYVFRLYVDEVDQDIAIEGEELVTNSWADWLDFVDWVDEWLELILRETVLVMLVCVVVRLVILEESASDVGTKELQVVSFRWEKGEGCWVWSYDNLRLLSRGWLNKLWYLGRRKDRLVENSMQCWVTVACIWCSWWVADSSADRSAEIKWFSSWY
jgi:hypothetical protein